MRNAAARWRFGRPQAFSFFSLDDLYAAPYFKSDHIRTGVVNAIVDAQRKAYRLLSGRDLRSVAEFGGAGGWFTGKFAALGLDYQTVEGTQAGTEKIKQRPGVQPDRIHRADLRSPIELPPPHAEMGLNSFTSCCARSCGGADSRICSPPIQSERKYASLS